RGTRCARGEGPAGAGSAAAGPAAALTIPATETPVTPDVPQPDSQEPRWSLERLRREYILTILRQTQGDHQGAARILGIDRRTLHSRVQRYLGTGAGGAR